MNRFCVRCSNELAIAPTSYCARCLKLELEELGEEADVVVIEVDLPPADLEPHEVWMLMYPTFGSMLS